MVEEILDEKCPECGGRLMGTSKTIQENRGAEDSPPYVEYWLIKKCENCDYVDEELQHAEQY